MGGINPTPSPEAKIKLTLSERVLFKLPFKLLKPPLFNQGLQIKKVDLKLEPIFLVHGTKP
jgi:hypothetical protein